MIFQKKKTAIDWLIVGLGNPGMAYEHTRHNAGYDALCVLAKDHGITLSKKQFKALVGTGEIAGKKVMLMFPQTFMNASGEAVREAMAFYKLSADQLLVLSDDIALNPGVVRVRKKGSDGGQKGLRSIIGCIGEDNFPRVRIGVGAKPHPAYDLADWVLSKFSQSDKKLVEECFEKAYGAIELIVKGEIEKAMCAYNG